jgi:hypothetical protein
VSGLHQVSGSGPLPESLHHTFVDYINELVDAGYTEDDAEDMVIEMMIIHNKSTKQDTIN